MARRPSVEIAKNLLGRRDFLKIAGAAAVVPSVLTAQAKGQTAKSSTPANNRINIGVIGMGWQGPGNIQAFLALDDCQVVAACDVDRNHLQAAVKMISDAYGAVDCKGYHDYRELLASPEIDVVMIAVPDHWHEIVATESARRKKDIYSEKPLAHTIAEQQSIVRAVKENNIVWQMGAWQRSSPIFHKAAEIVRNGLIGTVTHVEVGLPGENSNYDHIREETAAKLAAAGLKGELEKIVPGSKAWDLLVCAPPAELDYETWVGPARMEPYMKARSHKCWRLNYNTGGGKLLPPPRTGLLVPWARPSKEVRPRMYTEEEVAVIIQVSLSQLRKWRMKDNVRRVEGPPFRKISRMVRYPADALAYINGTRRIAAPQAVLWSLCLSSGLRHGNRFRRWPDRGPVRCACSARCGCTLTSRPRAAPSTSACSRSINSWARWSACCWMWTYSGEGDRQAWQVSRPTNGVRSNPFNSMAPDSVRKPLVAPFRDPV